MRSAWRWCLLLPLMAMGEALAQQSETRPACPPELAAAVADVLRQTGPAYVAARDRLLGRDAAELRACLETQRRKAGDALEQLGVEALLIRLTRGRAVDDLVKNALASLPESRPADTPVASRPSAHDPIRPSQVALLLAERLGDEATALTAELLVKGLAQDWPITRRQALVLTLPAMGHVRQAHGRLSPAREPRAGHVLLWLLEHEEHEPTLRLAAQGMRRFASPPMIAAVRALETRLRAAPTASRLADARQSIIAPCLRGMEAEQRILERLGDVPASQPASAPGP